MAEKGELPKATIHNLLKETIRPDYKVSFSKEVVDGLVDLAREYVYVVGSKANDICMTHSRKTISKEHLY